MLNNLISDSLSRIRNGYMSKKRSVELLYSKYVKSVLVVLQKEGYVGEHSMVEKPTAKKRGVAKYINLNLTYFSGVPSTKQIATVSKPGCKRYIQAKDLLNFYNKFGKSGLGTVLLSTSVGILAGHEAVERNLGGEIICIVF
jgi:small subunit ribosomal protein S8